MRFDAIIQNVRSLPCFDLALLAQLTHTNKRQISVQLHHWASLGRIIPLRRGLYTLSETWRQMPLSLPKLANEIYQPSYLTGLWVLSYYGLIPEKVTLYTSVSTRVTRRFENALGIFAYGSLKKNFFWGFDAQKIDGNEVWIAQPEKALLDFWHLTPGEWTEDRLAEMRWQNTDQIDTVQLTHDANRWQSPRLIQAAKRFIKVVTHDQEGYQTL